MQTWLIKRNLYQTDIAALNLFGGKVDSYAMNFSGANGFRANKTKLHDKKSRLPLKLGITANFIDILSYIMYL